LSASDRSTDELMWQHVHLSNYARSVADWRSWFAAADELQFAADLLKPQVTRWWADLVAWQATKARPRKFPALGCHSILMMLVSYVVEDLCKGAMVRDRRIKLIPALIARDGLPKELKTHQLRQLVRAVELQCSDEEQELMSRMTRAAVWRGRYPAAVKYSESIHTLVLDGGKKHSAAWFSIKDVERMEGLVATVREHIGAERSFSVARDAAP
jgi:hypothetical protein